MERIQVIDHRGRRVLRVDYSGLRTLGELEVVGQQASEAMRADPDGGLLVLVDMTGVPYTLRTFRRLSEIAASNASRVRARALVGLGTRLRELVGLFEKYSDRPVQAFDDVTAALDWLVAQEPAPAGPTGTPPAG